MRWQNNCHLYFFSSDDIYQKIHVFYFMAKLLNIGATYMPNYSTTSSDGTKRTLPCVMFFFDSDESTSKMVAALSGLKGLRVNGGAVTKVVKLDDYKKFIYGQGAFQKILSEFEKYGYVYDTNNLSNLEQIVEKEIQDVLTDDASSKIYTDNASFIDDIIKAMEENMNDPRFMSYVNAVGSIQYVGDDTLSKVTKLSTKNTIMVLSQWVNAGNQGQPTFLATRRQWQVFFHREVMPNATPLYAVAPKDTEKRSIRQTMSDYGISQQKYDSDAMVRKQVDTLTNDKDYGQYNNTSFGLNNPYYDYSQTTLIQGHQEVYDFDGVSNVDKDKSADDDKSRGDILKNAISGETPVDVKTVLSNITEYAIKTNNQELQTAANKGLRAAVEYMADNSKTILRENDQNKIKLYKNLIIALVLKRLRQNGDYSDKLIMNSMGQLRSYGGFNKKAFYAVSSDFENIIFVCKGITEGASPDTLSWVMDALGISPDEFRAMPRDEQEADEAISNVRESFIRTFNNILKHDMR